MRVTLAVIIAIIAATPAAAQTLQYRAPSGVEYFSLPDTGGVARAESALALEPRSVDRLLALALAQIAIRQYRESIRTLSRAIEIAPANAVLYRHRGHRYISVREFDRAVADLERGYQLDSTSYGILYHLGVVRFLRGEFARAADAFAAAQPRAPEGNERAGSTDWRWMSLSRAGRSAEAAAVLAALPDSQAGTGYWQRLRLYRGQIMPGEVIGSADTAGVTVATLLFGLGNWHLTRGEPGPAREAFQRAVLTDGWPAFGFMASDVELRRLR